MSSFLEARENHDDFGRLLKRSGLWCLGFGEDGPNQQALLEQNKWQNKMEDVPTCYNICQALGVRAEVLLVMGYPSNSAKRLLETVRHLDGFVRQVCVRPYHMTVGQDFVCLPFLIKYFN